jgi:alpha-beta hydrolase superfamily lysophospholipase
MTPAHVIEIATPQNFVLNGLWYGPKKPQFAIVLVHGMFSSAFSLGPLVEELVDDRTAVLTFNNRGQGTVNDVKQRVGMERKYHRAGTAHEVFTDAVDDIEGALRFARAQGAKKIYLAGHSTGCQKSIYYAFKKKDPKVAGIILLAPLSDYAGDRKKPQLRKAVALAKRMVKAGKGHELLPPDAWWHYVDAQRLLSLYTPDSIEEIFSYSQPDKKPKIYSSVTLPVLALFAGEDEYSERPAAKLVEWFTEHSRSKDFKAVVIPKVGHSFREGEPATASAIRKWILA